MQKPDHVFERDAEWVDLTAFASRAGAGATLGIVTGRPRQGKSYLLQALTAELDGLYFAASRETEALALRAFTDAVIAFTGGAARGPFRDWADAVSHVFGLMRDRPVPIVLDDFPYLMRTTSSLPSILQRELAPGGSGRASTARLLLCGSAPPAAAGRGPLRGLASLDLVVRPFGYRDAARFWNIGDPRLAAMTHAIVGGTPAYGRGFTDGDGPTSLADFDAWVVRTVLNPRGALFREARHLLAEETAARNPAVYHSVLAAVAEGHGTPAGIAEHVGRRSSEIAHPLSVLESSALLSREPDALRAGRPTYRITEPLVLFYEAVMRRHWARLELGRGAELWPALRPTFEGRVMGAQFAELCRDFARERGDAVFGETPRTVGRAVVSDGQNRERIQVDVVVMGRWGPNERARILSLGEARWDQVMDEADLARLSRARELLEARGFDVEDCVLACYGAAGFAAPLRERAANERVELIDLERLYAG
jgi:hypothetical protein